MARFVIFNPRGTELFSHSDEKLCFSFLILNSVLFSPTPMHIYLIIFRDKTWY